MIPRVDAGGASQIRPTGWIHGARVTVPAVPQAVLGLYLGREGADNRAVVADF